MDKPVIHPRIHERHPDIDADDVLSAWNKALLSAPRDDGTGSWVSIGMDGNGRLLELVSMHDRRGRWLVCHTMTPPSKKTLQELGARRRRS